MNNLDAFLKEEQGAGLIDSTGHFTIAADKALEKLAHSQLPDPSYWILKVVQFATSYGVKKMEVKVGARVTKVVMVLPAPLSVIQLQQGLDSVDPLPNSSLDHLVTGLRALGGVDSRVFVLNLKSSEVSEFLLWDGDKLSTRREDTRSDQPSLNLEVSSSGTGSIWDLDMLSRNRRTGEVHALGDRAFIAPLELRVDGRALTYDHLDEPRHFVQPILWDYAPFQDGAELPFFMKLDPNETIPASAFWNISFNYELIHKVLRASPEPNEMVRGSRVFWIKDGVIVKTSSLRPPWPFTIKLFVDCRHCPADLGGLNLRETQEFADKRKWVKRILTEISRQAVDRIANLDQLEGKTLGGWDTLIATTSHLPINRAVTYQTTGLVANTLNAHPGFRKKLLARIKKSAKKRSEMLVPIDLVL